MLYAALCADFSDSDSLDYLADLARGVNAPIRLFALSLLPPLLSAAGVTSAGCSLRRDANGRPFLLSRGGAARHPSPAFWVQAAGGSAWM